MFIYAAVEFDGEPSPVVEVRTDQGRHFSESSHVELSGTTSAVGPHLNQGSISTIGPRNPATKVLLGRSSISRPARQPKTTLKTFCSWTSLGI